MKLLQATLSTLVALLATSTTASPFSINALSTRQAGTYDMPDATDPARSGIVHCFRGGRWLSQDIVRGVLDQACKNGTDNEHSYDNAHFSFVPYADGTFPHQQVDHEFRSCFGSNPPACYPPTDTITFTGDLKAAVRADSDSCMYAMGRIVEDCHGDNQDTRGGWFEFNGDGSTYALDLHEH